MKLLGISKFRIRYQPDAAAWSQVEEFSAAVGVPLQLLAFRKQLAAFVALRTTRQQVDAIKVYEASMNLNFQSHHMHSMVQIATWECWRIHCLFVSCSHLLVGLDCAAACLGSSRWPWRQGEWRPRPWRQGCRRNASCTPSHCGPSVPGVLDCCRFGAQRFQRPSA